MILSRARVGIPPRGSFSDNMLLSKGSSPSQGPTFCPNRDVENLWKTPWHHMPPWHELQPIKKMMMIRIKENHHQREKPSPTTASLWKTTDARLRRDRERRMPAEVSHSSVPLTRRPQETGGTSRIPQPTTKTASRKYR